MSQSFYTGDNIDDSKYQQYKKLQQELDEKVREIQRVPGSLYDLQQEQYNTTIMVGVLWSMLATATLYYVFKNV